LTCRRLLSTSLLVFAVVALVAAPSAMAQRSAQVKFALAQGEDHVEVTVTVECRASPHELPSRMTVTLYSSYRSGGGFVEFASESREVRCGGDSVSVVFDVPSMGDGSYKFRAVVYDGSGALVAIGTIEPKMVW
jgi:hypothetical protein